MKRKKSDWLKSLNPAWRHRLAEMRSQGVPIPAAVVASVDDAVVSATRSGSAFPPLGWAGDDMTTFTSGTEAVRLSPDDVKDVFAGSTPVADGGTTGTVCSAGGGCGVVTSPMNEALPGGASVREELFGKEDSVVGLLVSVVPKSKDGAAAPASTAGETVVALTSPAGEDAAVTTPADDPVISDSVDDNADVTSTATDGAAVLAPLTCEAGK